MRIFYDKWKSNVGDFRNIFWGKLGSVKTFCFLICRGMCGCLCAFSMEYVDRVVYDIWICIYNLQGISPWQTSKRCIWPFFEPSKNKLWCMYSLIAYCWGKLSWKLQFFLKLLKVFWLCMIYFSSRSVPTCCCYCIVLTWIGLTL